MVTPINASWNAAGGDWSTAANWNEPNPNAPPTYLHYVPGASDAVDISNAGSTPFTVTYNTTDEISSFSGGGNVTLDMTGGTLTIDNSSFTSDEIDVGTGATLNAASGATVTFSAGVIGGTLGGAGTVSFSAGAFTLNAGAVISTANLVLGVNSDGFGSMTTLNANFSYGGAFAIVDYSGDNAVLHLNSHTMTLTGTATLDGEINGPGTLVIDTTAPARLIASITGGATVEIKTSAQHMTSGYSTLSVAGEILVDAGASFTTKITGSVGGAVATAFYVNNGSFIDDSGGGHYSVTGQFTNNGTLTVDATDTMQLIGTNTLGGTLNGAGTLVIGAGATTLNTATVTVAGLGIDGGNIGAVLTLGTNLSYGGAFAFDNQFDQLALNGHALTLTGTTNTLANLVAGGGTLKVTGSATFGYATFGASGGTAPTITDAGSVTQTGYVTLNGALLQVLSGATYTVAAAVNTVDGTTTGTSKVTNAGTFTDDSGGGTSRLTAQFTNTGTLTVDATDTLVLGGVETLGGTINGAGTLVIGAGTTTLNTSAVTVAALGIDGGNIGATLNLGTNLSYGGTFAFDNQFDTLNLKGHTLTLSGASNVLSNTVNGAGTITIKGTTTVDFLTAGATGATVAISNQSTVTETQGITLTGSLDNASGAIFDVTVDAGINTNGTETLTNEGTIEKTAGTGTSTITAALTSTGTIDAQTGVIAVRGTGGTISGVLKGNEIDLRGGGTYTLSSALSTLSVATLGWYDIGTDIVLGKNTSYAGTLNVGVNFGNLTIDLGTHTLTVTKAVTLTGAYGAVVITDGGKFVVANGATADLGGVNIAGGVTFENAGALSADYDIYLDSDSGTAQSLFQNDATGVVTVTQDRTIFSQTGTAALLTNAGKIVKTAGTGTSDIDDALTNTGTLEVDTGQIALHDGGSLSGTVKGLGTLILRGGTTYDLTATLSTLSIATLDWYDIGTDIVLGKDVSYAGTLNAGVNFGNLTIDLGAHTLTVTKAVTLTGAYGAVVVTDGGKFVVAKGATADLGGVDIAGGVTFENAGALSADYDIDLDSDSGTAQSLFQNDATGVVTVTQDRTIFSQTGAAALLTNAGKIVKTTGTGTSDIDDALTNTGTLEVDTGQIALHDGGTLGGTLSGAGTLALRSGGAYTLSAGVKVTVGTLDLSDSGTSATVAGNISTATAFNDAGGAVLSLTGGYLLLTGAASFSNATVTGSQRLYAEGATTIAGLTIGGTAVFETTKTATQAGGTVTVGDTSSSAAILLNYTGATYAITDDSSIARGTATGSQILNQGLFEKTGGTSTSTVAVSFVDTGSVAVTSGTLAFTGPSNSFAGAISGAGAIVLGGATTLKSGTTASVSSLSLSGSGTAVTLAENLTYAGSFTQGAGTTLAIGSGDTLVLKGGGSIGGSVTGAGTLYLSGGTTALNGGAALGVANLTESGAGTTLTVGANLSSASVFRQGAGAVLSLTGGYLNLSGAASFAGTVTGSQRLYAKGATSVSTLSIGGTAVFEDTKTVTQAGGTVTVGDTSSSAAVLLNYTGATYAIADNSGIAHGAAASSYILNQGLFEKTGGTGTSTVAASFVDTGTIKVGTGTLAFTGPSNSFAGAISGAGTLALGGASTLKSGTSATVGALTLSGAGAMVSVATNLTYGGAFTEAAGSVLSLTGGYLLLSGTASLAGTVNGSQRLYAEGTSTTIAGLTIGGTAILETTKAVTQAGSTVTVGDTTSSAAVLYTYGGSVYSIADDSSIARGTAAGSYILDQGTLQKTGGTGTSTIAPNIVNNTSAAGTVGVTSGTLDLGGTLSGNLTLAIGAGATLILEKSAAAGAAAAFSGSTGTLQLGDAQDYRGSIAGFAGGTTLDLRSIGFGAGTTTTLGYSGTTSSGTLTVSDGTRTANLSMIGSYTKASFALAGDSHGGSAITLA